MSDTNDSQPTVGRVLPVPESDIRPNHSLARISSTRIRHLIAVPIVSQSFSTNHGYSGMTQLIATTAVFLTVLRRLFPMSGSDCPTQAGRRGRESLAKLLQPVLPSFYQIPRLIWIRPFTRSSAKLWLNWISLIKIYPLSDVCYVLRTISPSDLFLRSGSVLLYLKQDVETYLKSGERTIRVLCICLNKTSHRSILLYFIIQISYFSTSKFTHLRKRWSWFIPYKTLIPLICFNQTLIFIAK